MNPRRRRRNPSDAGLRQQGREWGTPEEGMHYATALRRRGEDHEAGLVEAKVAELVYASEPTWEHYVALAESRSEAGFSYEGKGLDRLINELTLLGGSEQIGDVQESGFFARVELGPEFVHFAISEEGGPDEPGREPLHPNRFHVDDFRLAMQHAGAILRVNDLGQRWVDLFGTQEEFDAAWQEAEDRVAEWHGEDDEDDDDEYDDGYPIDYPSERGEFYGREQ